MKVSDAHVALFVAAFEEACKVAKSLDPPWDLKAQCDQDKTTRHLFRVYYLLHDNMAYDDSHPRYRMSPRFCRLKADEMAEFRRAGYKDAHIETMMKKVLACPQHPAPNQPKAS